MDKISELQKTIGRLKRQRNFLGLTAIVTTGLLIFNTVVRPAPAPCCTSNMACNVPPPQNFTANINGATSTLDLTWQAVDAGTFPDFNYYLIQAFDVTDNVLLFSETTSGTSASIPITINHHDIRATATSVCDNCAPGDATTIIDVCEIVIDDIVMMTPQCLGGGCDAAGTDNDPASTDRVNFGASPEIFKAEINCANGESAWFIVQLEIQNGNEVLVNLPQYPDLNDHNPGANCPNCTNYDPPEKTECGELENGLTPVYKLEIDQSANEVKITDYNLNPANPCTATIEKRPCR